MKSINGISSNVINRLPRYLRYLCELQDRGIERVSSREIADAMNSTASQVRQDFSIFGSYGVQGYGYQIDHLIHTFEKILGLNKVHNVIIVGVGSIGKALLEHMDFDHYNYNVCAAFDVDPSVIGTVVNGVTVYGFDEFEQVTDGLKIDICMLTVSKDAARRVANQLRKRNITAIWNFTNEELNLHSDDVFVQNVNLLDSLFTLTYYMEENNLRF